MPQRLVRVEAGRSVQSPVGPNGRKLMIMGDRLV
jgi:hypothetical protein